MVKEVKFLELLTQLREVLRIPLPYVDPYLCLVNPFLFGHSYLTLGASAKEGFAFPVIALHRLPRTQSSQVKLLQLCHPILTHLYLIDELDGFSGDCVEAIRIGHRTELKDITIFNSLAEHKMVHLFE